MINLHLDGNPESLMLLDITQQQTYTDDNKKETYLNIIYKDLDTGQKYLKAIKDAKMDIHFAKDEYRNYEHNKSFIELDKTFVVESADKDISKTIAKEAGGKWKQLYDDAVKTNWKDMALLKKYPYVFGSDIPIDVFYRRLFIDKYGNNKRKKLTKGFLDIEVDTIDVLRLPEYGECPINAISLMDKDAMICHTMLLRNSNNPLIEEFEKDIDSFIDELHETFDESYGIIDYRLYMYDTEEELIQDIFNLINQLKLDIIAIWNGWGFDIPYIIERIKVLGMDPNIVMTHPDFPIRNVYLKRDTVNFMIKNKTDSTKISSYTKFTDQMVVYAANRKGQSEQRSYSLGNIAKAEIKDDKLDYSDETNIATFPYENYRKFVMYGIKDVLLQFGIENRTTDLEALYDRGSRTLTTWDNVYKQTVALRNRAYYDLYKEGIILGVNINVLGTKLNEKFVGAIVGDPMLNKNAGKRILGKISKFIFDNVIDMDFSSMYPHIMIAFNIERHTMIGKLLLLNPDGSQRITQLANMFMNRPTLMEDYLDDEEEAEILDDGDIEYPDKYDAGKDFVDNLLTEDTLSLGHKWFDLPTVDKVVEGFGKIYGKEKPSRKITIFQPRKVYTERVDVKYESDK